MTISKNKFWQFLENHPKQNASWAEWLMLLGNGDTLSLFAKKYLQPTGQRILSIPCRTACRPACCRRIVEHAPDDIVAVCPYMEDSPYKISKKDTLVYEVNSAFYQGLCDTLGVTAQNKFSEEMQSVVRLGDYIPAVGESYPVYLSFTRNTQALHEAVKDITLLGKTYILLLPRRNQLSPPSEELMRQSCAVCIILSEELTLAENAEWEASRESQDIFACFHKKPSKLPSKNQSYFETPLGTQWNDIEMRFVDGHTVAVRAKGVHGQYSYTQMGMVNTRNGKPSALWNILELFSQEYGTISWKSHGSSDKIKDQKSQLSRALRTFFKLSGSPIDYDKTNKSYKCNFLIFPVGVDFPQNLEW